MIHSLPVRIYYEDTDAGGIVYYPNYLKFMERGRTEFLRELGFENSTLEEDEGVLFVVRRVEADYLKPARLDDVLELKTTIEKMGGASFVMRQNMWRGEEQIFAGHVTLVCVDSNNIRPVQIPDDVAQAFAPYTEKE